MGRDSSQARIQQLSDDKFLEAGNPSTTSHGLQQKNSPNICSGYGIIYEILRQAQDDMSLKATIIKLSPLLPYSFR